MSVQAGVGESSNYFYRFCAVVRLAGTQLVRSPSHSRRAEAARRSARHGLLLTATVAYTVYAMSDISWRVKQVVDLRAPVAIASTVSG